MQQQNQNIAQTAAVATIQAQMTVAKASPRKKEDVMQRVMDACNDASFAPHAVYKYKKSNVEIEGPSIRLAETLVRCFTNVDYGINVILRGDKYTHLEVYALDLETNVRPRRLIEVPHVRDTREGPKPLKSQRDILEMETSQAQRQLRACILQLIPADITAQAVSLCKRVMAEGEVEVANVQQIVHKFAQQGVTKAMLVKKYGDLDHLTSQSVADMRIVYNSIVNDGQDAEQYFQQKQIAHEPDPVDALVSNDDSPPDESQAESASTKKAENTATDPAPSKETPADPWDASLNTD